MKNSKLKTAESRKSREKLRINPTGIVPLGILAVGAIALTQETTKSIDEYIEKKAKQEQLREHQEHQDIKLDHEIKELVESNGTLLLLDKPMKVNIQHFDPALQKRIETDDSSIDNLIFINLPSDLTHKNYSERNFTPIPMPGGRLAGVMSSDSGRNYGINYVITDFKDDQEQMPQIHVSSTADLGDTDLHLREVRWDGIDDGGYYVLFVESSENVVPDSSTLVVAVTE